MKKLLALTAAATALFSTRVYAVDVNDARYLTVDPDSVVIQEIVSRGGTIDGNPTGTNTIPSPGQLPAVPSLPSIGGVPAPTTPDATGTTPAAPTFQDTLNNINGTVNTIDQIVNLVDKVWTLIAKNQPVVTVNVNYANAVPYGLTHWTQLQGWSKPATKKYSFTMKNGFGANVVDVVYQVKWTHSGNYQGKGKYLTGVTVEPISVTTAWGYNVDLVAEVPDSTIANVGTTADPIASMQVQLKWKVHTAVKDIQQKAIYYVQGDGLMQPISKAYDRGVQQQYAGKAAAASQNISSSKF